MRILSMGAKILSRSSPVLLVGGGAAIVFALPAVRRGLRATLVAATRGALIITDKVHNLAEKIRDETSEIVEEARQADCCPCPAAKFKSLGASAKVKGRRMAVATTAGVLNVQDKAKSIRDEFQDIIHEAKRLKIEAKSNSKGMKHIDKNMETNIEPDGLEAAVNDVGPDEQAESTKVTE
ncbi:hypothetical protein [Sporomusa aerivorans]|uniref:hypothetical protein n=1 Tax=Sporomusa aerivorans TaxID=204936 RepID=UPI00352ADB2B